MDESPSVGKIVGRMDTYTTVGLLTDGGGDPPSSKPSLQFEFRFVDALDWTIESGPPGKIFVLLSFSTYVNMMDMIR